MRKSTEFSKSLVLAIVIVNVIFTTAFLWVFLQTGSEPTALVAAWFAFTTGELWFLAGIEKAKMKGGDKNGTKKVVSLKDALD